jgi:hypothetical protein
MLKGYTNRRTVGGIGKNQASENSRKGTLLRFQAGNPQTFQWLKNLPNGSYPARTGNVIPGHFSALLPGPALPRIRAVGLFRL